MQCIIKLIPLELFFVPACAPLVRGVYYQVCVLSSMCTIMSVYYHVCVYHVCGIVHIIRTHKVVVSYFLSLSEWSLTIQLVLHDRCNRCCGMSYAVCGMMHIKEPLLLNGKRSPCGGSGFPLLLSEWSFTICLTPYNRK